MMIEGPGCQLDCVNRLDDSGNPVGGTVDDSVPGHVEECRIHIEWQNGPRGRDADGNLLPPNGAFVEDVIIAARQRLEFFQSTKFKCDANRNAIGALDAALGFLADRAKERNERGVLGSHTV